MSRGSTLHRVTALSGRHEALDTAGKIKDTLYLSGSCPACTGGEVNQAGFEMQRLGEQAGMLGYPIAG